MAPDPVTPPATDEVPIAPLDLSFAAVNDFVHEPGQHYEHLQWLCLSLATALENATAPPATDADVERVEELDRLATKGPWEFVDAYGEMFGDESYKGQAFLNIDGCGSVHFERANDAKLAAEYRSLVPRLAVRLTSVGAERDELSAERQRVAMLLVKEEELTIRIQAELASLRSRLAAAEVENRKYADLMVVAHPDGSQTGGTPDSLRGLIDELQSEWDTAETRLAAARQRADSAEAALAELRRGSGDDGDEIDSLWLEETGWTRADFGSEPRWEMTVCNQDHGSDGKTRHWLCIHEPCGSWWPIEFRQKNERDKKADKVALLTWVDCITRGHVRRLLTALGITPTESPKQ